MSNSFDNFMAEIKGISKTASAVENPEPTTFDKTAAVNGVMEDSTFLTVAGDALMKTASQISDPDLAAVFAGLGQGLSEVAHGMLSGIQKTASNNHGEAMLDAIQMQDDLSKYASVLVKTANALEDQGLAEIAEATTDMANEMYDHLEEVAKREPEVAQAIADHYGLNQE